MKTLKYENLPVVCRAFGDYKTLAFVSGNTKAEIRKEVKAKALNIRGNGLVWIDNPDFPKAINSNLL